MGMMNRFNEFFRLNDEELAMDEAIGGNYDEEPELRKPQMNKQTTTNRTDPAAVNMRKEQRRTPNVVSMHQTAQQGKIIIMEPRVYSEVKEIADILLKQQAVVLNFKHMEKDQAKKTVDFLMGTIYAIDGDMQRVGNEIFLCTPKNVEIDGVLEKNGSFKDLKFY
ncbi:cell division protein SepF [Pisciglobus halotolerans]|uniref:Cell division protein SepF n=1 Tax=Pisciglobus halotolerans TaxID=745365 RepID=A0A1I3BWC4_9LACT|nr:cell division protein SepF [Pisciglobus halotolerans]SFH66533.1 cell division inhibitor SepF [Pisciglobus halotolerans]